MLKFYYTPGTVSLATHIALEDAGADYSLHLVDFSQDMQKSPDYLKLNPKARVPVLITPEGVISETPAMLAYVAQAFPDSNIAPINDAYAFAQIQSFNSYLCSSLHVAHAHSVRGIRWTDDDAAIESMRIKAPEVVNACYQYIEDHVFVGPFVMGDTYSIADPYLFAVAQWIESDGVDPANYPKLAAHMDMMEAREPVQKALQTERKR